MVVGGRNTERPLVWLVCFFSFSSSFFVAGLWPPCSRVGFPPGLHSLPPCPHPGQRSLVFGCFWCLRNLKAFIERRHHENDLSLKDLPSELELQKIAFHIVVLANPDAYVFSMSGKLENRMKRKNMADSGCPDPLSNGVDLNRNFPVGFNVSSSNDFCGCRDDYGGKHPCSEPETTSLRSSLSQSPPWLFIDIHTSLGAWLTPPASRSALFSCQWTSGLKILI